MAGKKVEKKPKLPKEQTFNEIYNGVVFDECQCGPIPMVVKCNRCGVVFTTVKGFTLYKVHECPIAVTADGKNAGATYYCFRCSNIYATHTRLVHHFRVWHCPRP